MLLGNSPEVTVTRDRALILVGPFDKDAAKEPVVVTTRPIVHAFMILAQMIEGQGGVGNAVADDNGSGKPRVICPDCNGYAGFDDHYGNWTECAT